MANDLKNEIVPLYNNVMVQMYEEDPYDVKETKEGFTVSDGEFENPDSGEVDKKDHPIKCGKIIEVGKDCKYAYPGDDCYFDVRTCRIVKFRDEYYWIIAEPSLLTLMK